LPEAFEFSAMRRIGSNVRQCLTALAGQRGDWVGSLHSLRATLPVAICTAGGVSEGNAGSAGRAERALLRPLLLLRRATLVLSPRLNWPERQRRRVQHVKTEPVAAVDAGR
jgi:hypothetical protein